MRAAVTYGRVSTGAQADHGTSLESQRVALQRFCADHELRIIEHVEDSFSGGSLHRPGIERIRELAQAGAIQYLICFSLDRLARDNFLGTGFLRWLQECGVETVFASEQYDKTPEGELFRGIRWEFAAFERNLIRARLMRGKAERARAGRVPNNWNIYGYHVISRAEGLVVPELLGQGGTFRVIEEEAAVVRRIFREYVGGSSMRAIYTRLNEEGLRTRRGAYWQAGTLRVMLQQPAYYGEAAYGRQTWKATGEKTAAGRPRPRVTDNPPEQWIRIPCPILVDRETWDRAQVLLAHHQPPGRSTDAWPLRGCIVCGHCHGLRGGPLRCYGRRTSHDPQRNAYRSRRYGCAAGLRPGMEYCSVVVKAEPLEAEAERLLRDALEPGELGRRAWAEAEAELKQLAGLAADLEQLRREDRDLAEQARRLAKALALGAALDALEEELRDIDQRREAVKARRRLAERQIGNQRTPAAAFARAEELSARARGWLDRLPEEPWRLAALFRAFIRITLYRDEAPRIVVLTDAVLPT